jgi:cytoskeletal protein RodZ
MTDSKEAARARGRVLRSERASRARAIRRRVISGAVAVFVAAWLMIAIVLVSGHDPALARKASTTSSASTVASTPSATTSTPSTTTTTSGSGSTASSSDSSSSSSSSSNNGVSSVTTTQS